MTGVLQRRGLTLGLVLVMAGCAGSGSLGKLRSDAEERRLAAMQVEEPEPPKSIEEQISEADELRDAGQLERALWAYLEAVRRDPKATRPRERIGYLQLGRDVERAEAIFAALAAEDPDDPSAHRGLGLARLARGDHGEARVALERSALLAPDSALTEYSLAVVNSLLDAHPEALRRALRARDLDPDHPGMANTTGVCQLAVDDSAAAEDSFRDAIRLDPRMPAFHNNLGLALARQERFDEAADAFRRGGDEQAALNNLGVALHAGGHYDRAIEHYERALATEGDQKRVVLRNLRRAVAARDRSADY